MIKYDKNVFITDCFYYKNIFKNLDELIDENLKKENESDILKVEPSDNDSHIEENHSHKETPLTVLNGKNEKIEGEITNENVLLTKNNNKLNELDSNNKNNYPNEKPEEKNCNINSYKCNEIHENDKISLNTQPSVKNDKKLFLKDKKIYLNIKKKEINKIICKEFQDDYEESISDHNSSHEKIILKEDSLNDLENVNMKQNNVFNIKDQEISNNYINNINNNSYNDNHNLNNNVSTELNEYENLIYKEEKTQSGKKRNIYEKNPDDISNIVKKYKGYSETKKFDLNSLNHAEKKDNNKKAHNLLNNNDDDVLFNLSNKNFFNFHILFEKNKKLKEEFFLKNQIIEKTLLLNLKMEYSKFIDTSFFPVSNTCFYNHYFDDNFFFFIRSSFKLDLFIKIQRKNIFLSEEKYFEFLKIHLMNKCKQNNDIKFYLSNYTSNDDDTLIQILEKCFKNLNSEYDTSNSLLLYDAINEISFLLSQIRIYIKEIDILLRLDIDKKTNITTISILKKKL